MAKPSSEIRANVPAIYAPPIIESYMKCGIKYYLCQGDRHFVADTYDHFFKVIPGKIKPKNYRDNQIGKAKQLKGL